MSKNKPRDVQVYPIATDTRILRSRSWSRLRFEIEYALAKGTTANSYLIESDKNAIIDPPGETFTQFRSVTAAFPSRRLRLFDFGTRKS